MSSVRTITHLAVNRAGDHMFGRRLLAQNGSIIPEQAADPAFDLKSALT